MSPLAVRCPSCGAGVQEHCRAPASGELISLRKHGKTKSDRDKKQASLRTCAPHASRLTLAQQGIGTR